MTGLTRYQQLLEELPRAPKKWLVTGAAGFIGSNLVEHLLNLNQSVVGLDNFATGHQRNLDEVESLVGESAWKKFQFIEGDIRDSKICNQACVEVDYVLHQAALGSVPRSLKDPATSNAVNISGFLNMLIAARDAKVKSFVYAASSSTYGDHPDLPKVEDKIGNPLSPYAVTKFVNELYASVFSRSYGFHGIGLRYFNVFGPRQDPNGAYAAVIPKWVDAMLSGQDVFINGDGETSRDFCYIENAVQANLLAATTKLESATVCNVALNAQTTLNELFEMIRADLELRGKKIEAGPVYRDFRNGDVRHSRADISHCRQTIGYGPEYTIEKSMPQAIDWYINSAKKV